MGLMGHAGEIRVNGVVYTLASESLPYDEGSPEVEKFAANNGAVWGTKETHTPPYIECEIADKSDLNQSELLKTRDATVTVRLKSGKQLTLVGADGSKHSNQDAEDGKIKVRFIGTHMEVIPL